MRVLAINPPVYTFNYLHSICNYPPGLYNVATHYKQSGHDIEILDMNPEIKLSQASVSSGKKVVFNGSDLVSFTGEFSKCGNFDIEKISKAVLRVGLPDSTLIEKLSSNTYDRILVQCTFTYYWRGAHEIIQICKKVQPKAEVWFGGVYPTLCYEHAIGSGADKVIRGRTLDEVFTDVDTGLFPYRPSRVAVSTSLGCKNKCKYCAVRHLEGCQKYRRNPAEVIDQMLGLCYTGFNKIRLLDSNLLDEWDIHIRDILLGIIKSKARFDITTYGGVETDLVNEEVVELMAKSGFSKIVIPLEDSNDLRLSFWNRPNSIKQFVNSVKIASKYYSGNSLASWVLIGFKGQRYEDAVKTIEFCVDSGSHPLLLSFTPIPGTELMDTEGRQLEDLNPMLWPNAWDGFTVRQMEELFCKYNKGFISSFRCDNEEIEKRIFTTGPAIYF